MFTNQESNSDINVLNRPSKSREGHLIRVVTLGLSARVNIAGGSSGLQKSGGKTANASVICHCNQFKDIWNVVGCTKTVLSLF